jgi:hypothetical protein
MRYAYPYQVWGVVLWRKIMVYTVVFSREAKKSIDGLEEIEKRRIKDRINELMAKRVVA